MEHRNRCYSNWPSPENIIYVAKSGNDANPGTFSAPFLTINAANNYFIANKPTYPARGIVLVAPGIYEEQLEAAFYRIYIVGESVDPSFKDKSVTLYNTGADADHYPFKSTINTGINLIGIQVETDSGGTIGKVTNTSTFSYCKFKNGSFIQNADVSTYLPFYFCYFLNAPFKFTGTSTKYIDLVLDNCDVSGGTSTFESTGSPGNNQLKLKNTMFDEILNIKGDWSFLMQWSEMYGDDAKLTFDTDGWVDIFASTVAHGIHFTTDTALTKKVVNCIFKHTPDGEGDITANAPIEFIEYSGNHQDHGIDGEVITVSKIKNVGGGQNVYRNIHEALQGSIIDTIINLEGDVTVSTPLVINPNIDVQIDGNKKWKLTSTHATTLAELGNNQQLSFVNMKQIVGGKKIILNGTNTHLSLVSCGRYTEQNYVNVEINSADASSCVYMVKTTLAGTGGPAVKISDVDPCIIIDRSFIKGATGHPAVEWTVDGDNKFRSKYSTFVHGDEGSNAPLEGVSANDVTISMYNCGLNAVWNPADFTNTIVTANITVDSSIIF